MDGYVSKPLSGQFLEEEIASVMGEGDKTAMVPRANPRKEDATPWAHPNAK